MKQRRIPSSTEDELPDFESLPTPSSVIEEIRRKILAGGVDVAVLTYWNASHDIEDVTIVQREECKYAYIYRAPRHLPHVVVDVDRHYNITGSWIRL